MAFFHILSKTVFQQTFTSIVIYHHKLAQNTYLFGHCFAFITKPFPIWNIIFFQGRITDKQNTTINKYVKTWTISTFELCGFYTSFTCHHWYNSTYVRNFQKEKKSDKKQAKHEGINWWNHCDFSRLKNPCFTQLVEDIQTLACALFKIRNVWFKEWFWEYQGMVVRTQEYIIRGHKITFP